MVRLKELEVFYKTKYEKEHLVNAINNINAKTDFELFLKENLTIKDFMFTFLSYKTSWNDFSYLWKAFGENINAKYLLRESFGVVRDKYFDKNELALSIRFYLSEKQKKNNL